MNSPKMPSPRPKTTVRTVRWLWPAALLALAPKCLLCVLAYAGVGAAFGLGGPEMCGSSADSPTAWPTTLAWVGVALSLGTLGLLAHRRNE